MATAVTSMRIPTELNERYCRGNYLNAERKRKCVEQSGAKE